ncbi:MAG: glycosyltransferase family 2 protein [candidate division WOR-3 bacterium]
MIIPLYNESTVIPELFQRLKNVLDTVVQNYEVIFVDDGSVDDTWSRVRQLADIDARFLGLRLSRNFGQHYAITAGLDNCDGDWVVIMDGDLQDQPEDIPLLFSKAKEGFDVVLARREHRSHGLFKRISSRLFWLVFNYLTGMDYDERVGNFRIISRRVLENLKVMREQLRFLGGMVSWLGFPQTTVSVRHAPRTSGKTSYTPARLWRLAQEIVIAWSDRPLRLAVRLGFAVTGIALIYGAYIVVKALVRGVPVPGWSSLIVSLYFLFGVTFVILGLIGTYLGRTFAEVKRRPLYVIMETTSRSCRQS